MQSILSKTYSALLLSLSLVISAQAEVKLETATDLQSLGKANPNEVIVLLVSQDGCAFCVTVKEDFLKPLLQTADAPPIQVLDLSNPTPVINFDGSTGSAEQVAKSLGGRFTPTILFVDGKGETRAKKIVGVNTPEFYGFYIDEAIKSARNSF